MDDFVICCRPGNAEAAMTRMAKLMARLGLEVDTTKTRIARLPEEQFAFLGYSDPCRVLVKRTTASTWKVDAIGPSETVSAAVEPVQQPMTPAVCPKLRLMRELLAEEAAAKVQDDRAQVSATSGLMSGSQIGPALLFQLGDPGDASWHLARLREQGDILFLRKCLLGFGVATAAEHDPLVAQGSEPFLHR
jgi:hypothetical protein